MNRLLVKVRNLRSRHLFKVLYRECKGVVLDVGGGSLLEDIRGGALSYQRWVIAEPANNFGLARRHADCVIADGCNLPFGNNSFDTVTNIHVLEHVFDPLCMIREMTRVAKPGATIIIYVPQTSVVHLVPFHYYNLTLFWLKRVLDANNLELVEHHAQGGFWSTTASHMVHLFVKVARVNGFTTQDSRGVLYYLLLPFMLIWAFVNVPICMLLSLGDLHEEANNHLVVARKPT